MSPTALVTGANSGIGEALVKILISEGYSVIATDVNIGGPIQQLNADRVIQLDVSDPGSIKSLVEQLVPDLTLDLLLNVAGVIAPAAKDKFESIELSVLQKTFAINSYGPLLLSQALLPMLLRSKQPKICMVSSRVGSIADNSSGGSYAYRASKAALNSISKSMSVDLRDRGINVVIGHPGITITNLVPEDHSNPRAVPADVAARELWDVLKSKGIEDTGRFWHRDGNEIPW